MMKLASTMKFINMEILLSKSMVESVIPAIVQIGSKLIEYFQNKKDEREDEIEATDIILDYLIGVYGALIKADEVMYNYSHLIQNSSGNSRDIFIQGFNEFYFNRIQGYLDRFLFVLNEIDKLNPQITNGIKVNSCGDRVYLESALKSQLDKYSLIAQSGAKFTSYNISDILDAFRNVTECYTKGVGNTLKKISQP